MSMLEGEVGHLPDSPYRGLNYYGPKDAPLLAGREEHVKECCRVLGHPHVQVLILHGRTASGKSSFLRAGLIPHLERYGFEFFKEHGGKQETAIFIRSTDRPLVNLVAELYERYSYDRIVETPLGQITLPFSKLFESYTEPAKLGELYESLTKTPPPDTITRIVRKALVATRVGSNVYNVVELLQGLSGILSKTLVIVIDQCEELFTLRPNTEGDKSRSAFFEFLKVFLRSKFDMKLIIATRSEHYAKFDTQLRRRIPEVEDREKVDVYELEELNDEQILASILRPTLIFPIENFGSPRTKYKFSFEDGLPQKILKDLRSAELIGGMLPAVQIVCERLYKATKSRPPSLDGYWKITEPDYRTLGAEKILDDYLTSVLQEFCTNQRLSRWQTRREIEGWKDLLCRLGTVKEDGTVPTLLVREEALREAHERSGLRSNFDEMMDYLSHEEQRITRKNQIVSSIHSQEVVQYSLGHDAVGLILNNWKIAQTAKVKPIRVMWAVTSLIVMAFSLLYLTVPIIALIQGHPVIDSLLQASIFLAFALLLGAASRACWKASHYTLRDLWIWIRRRFRKPQHIS